MLRMDEMLSSASVELLSLDGNGVGGCGLE